MSLYTQYTKYILITMVNKEDLKATDVIKVSPRVKRLIERKGKFGESYDAVLLRILSKPKPAK